MAMEAKEIEDMIIKALPDAQVTIPTWRVMAIIIWHGLCLKNLLAKAASANINWFTKRLKAKWAVFYMHYLCKPKHQNSPELSKEYTYE